MSAKHNTEVNDNPLNREYFDDVLDIFYDNIQKNEEFYKELHESYKNNQPTGFTLGTSKTMVDMSKVLSDVRATAITGATALLNAKKTIAELELKKKAQSVEEEKVNNDKEYIRNVLTEIHNVKPSKSNLRKSSSYEGRDIVSNASTHLEDLKEIKKLDELIDKKINEGSLQLTKNEKAMKYDFNDEVEIVYDAITSSVKAVKKGTTHPIADYPLERGQIDDIIRIEPDEGFAYSDNGKRIRITNVSST